MKGHDARVTDVQDSQGLRPVTLRRRPPEELGHLGLQGGTLASSIFPSSPFHTVRGSFTHPPRTVPEGIPNLDLNVGTSMPTILFVLDSE